ncbi:hypothetical protein, partial [Escherichia coli]|uniref:hypothetical protein n=1 Tax=Escherichia coli TaxID=562 RepID=UPI001FCF077C
EWVHVQLHQQKGMISLSPPTICNSAILSCQSGTWGTIGGKLKVTQLSTTGYLGQFDFCAIARMGNAEDAHYCQVVESPAGSRKWYKYEHKTGCIASCVTLN